MLKLDLIHYADDWEALYKNDELWRSDHSIRWAYDVMPELIHETIGEFNNNHPTWEDEDSAVSKHHLEICCPPKHLKDLLNYGIK